MTIATSEAPQGGVGRSAVDRIADFGAIGALASGGVAAVGTISLLVFVAIEGSATALSVSAEPAAFVRLADAFGGLAVLLAIPVAVRLHRAWSVRGGTVSGVTLVVGLLSLVGYAVVSLSYAAGLDLPATQGPLTVLAMGAVGLWIVVVNIRRADTALEGGLRRVGLVTGAGTLLLFVAYFAGGGTAGLAGGSFGLRSVSLAIAYAVGSFAWQIGYPIWSIWLGRRWQTIRAWEPANA